MIPNKELFKDIATFLGRSRARIGDYSQVFHGTDFNQLNKNNRAKEGDLITYAPKFIEVEGLGIAEISYSEVRVSRKNGRRTAKSLNIRVEEPQRRDLQIHLVFSSTRLELVGDNTLKDSPVINEAVVYDSFYDISTGQEKDPPLNLLPEMEVGFFEPAERKVSS